MTSGMPTESPMPPAMILCGGFGTRLREVTELLPKPMVPIGEQPILWHIMKSFAAFGVRRFILCLGYKREVFVDYFINYHLRTADATIRLGHEPDIRFHDGIEEADWEVTLAGTGIDSMTGARVARAARYLPASADHFFLTYGDGVTDLDLAALRRAHRAGGRPATVSAIHPAARFGEMVLAGDAVVGFDEKPAQTQGYINGGYMVLNRSFVDRYLTTDETCVLENEPIRRAVAAGDVGVFRHEGFWQCMDTPREYRLLNELWASGRAPWTKYW